MTNIILYTDSYKASHYLQYPPNTDYISAYIESRGCSPFLYNLSLQYRTTCNVIIMFMSNKHSIYFGICYTQLTQTSIDLLGINPTIDQNTVIGIKKIIAISC